MSAVLAYEGIPDSLVTPAQAVSLLLMRMDSSTGLPSLASCAGTTIEAEVTLL